jgi:hypothetical protein
MCRLTHCGPANIGTLLKDTELLARVIKLFNAIG